MKTTKVTVKGQITLPKEFRDEFGLEPGAEVGFVREEDGVKVIRVRPRKGQNVVERLGRIPLRTNRTTDQILAITRGED